MMQGGYAHAGHGCELFDAQGFGIVEAEPFDCFGGAVALLAERGDGAEMLSLRGMEQAVDDFALDQVAEEWNVLRGVEQVDEARTCIEEFDGGGADGPVPRASADSSCRGNSCWLRISRTAGISRLRIKPRIGSFGVAVTT